MGRATLRVALALAFATSCTSGDEVTRALVEVRTNVDALISIRVEASNYDAPHRAKTAALPLAPANGSERLLSFAVAPRPDRNDGMFLLVVSGLDTDEKVLVQARAVATFIPGQYIHVPVWLESECQGIDCPDPATTCSPAVNERRRGQCVPIVPGNGPAHTDLNDAGANTEEGDESAARPAQAAEEGTEGTNGGSRGDESSDGNDVDDPARTDASIAGSARDSALATPRDAGHIDTNVLDAADAEVSDDDAPSEPMANRVCTRESLKEVTDRYFDALAMNNPSLAPLAASAKYTENGAVVRVGEGLWLTAGELRFKHSALDATTCNSVTEAVIAEAGADIPLGLRLKLNDGVLTEIEAIVVRTGDYYVASNTGNITTMASDMWEAPIPPDERWSREQLESWINKYFELFPSGGCDFSDDCLRSENGFELPCAAALSCSDAQPSATGVMTPRLIVVDEYAGLAAGFVVFSGQYTDFHLIKVRGGKVVGLRAVLAEAEGGQSGWE